MKSWDGLTPEEFGLRCIFLILIGLLLVCFIYMYFSEEEELAFIFDKEGMEESRFRETNISNINLHGQKYVSETGKTMFGFQGVDSTFPIEKIIINLEYYNEINCSEIDGYFDYSLIDDNLDYSLNTCYERSKSK